MNNTLAISFLPDELPLLGSLPRYQKDRAGFQKRAGEHGDVCGFHLGPQTTVLFGQPEFIHSLLVERAADFDKGEIQHRAFPGKGLFISEEPFHASQRRIMTPAFSPRAIAVYGDIMSGYAESAAAKWAEEQTIDITEELRVLTTRIIGKTVFGVEDFDQTAICQALVTIFDCAAYTITHPFSLLVPENWPTPWNRKREKAWQVMLAEVQKIIKERPHTEGDDMLSVFLKRGSEMSHEQLTDELATLFGGGQETVANALAWTWFLLSTHPEIYQQVQAEVDQVLCGRTPTLQDLKALPLCLQVFKETLRLFPPASVVIRQALRDTVITSDKNPQKRYAIKKGWLVMAGINQIHRRANLYPEPETFDPLRHFSPEAEQHLPKYGFFPFGAGPRVCIGNHFAMMEGHLLLATLAQRATFSLTSTAEPPMSNTALTTRPVANITVKVHKR